MTLFTTRHDTAQPHERPHGRLAEGKEHGNEWKTDQIKGRIKEAAGVLTDNDRLKRKGEARSGGGEGKGKSGKGSGEGEENSGEDGGYNERRLTCNTPSNQAK